MVELGVHVVPTLSNRVVIFNLLFYNIAPPPILRNRNLSQPQLNTNDFCELFSILQYIF